MMTISSPLTAGWSWIATDLFNHLWQSTAVALAVLFLLTFSGRLPAKTRRVLGWMALLKFALPVALVVRLVAMSGSALDRWFGARTFILPPNWSPGMLPISTTSAAPAGYPVPLVLAGVWLTIAMGLLGLWVIRGIRARRTVLADTGSVSEALEQAIVHAASLAQVHKLPRRLSAPSHRSPGLLGIFSPILILPRGIEETLSPAELESVLIHELVHLRRRDNLWATVQAVFGTILWFHPLVALLNRRISTETEKSCDERVLEITQDPKTYAGGIVKCVRHSLGIPQPGFSSISAPPALERLKGILSYGSRRDLPALNRTALAAGVLLLVLSGHAGSFAAAPAKSVASEDRSTSSASANVPRPSTTIPPLAPPSSASAVEVSPSSPPQFESVANAASSDRGTAISTVSPTGLSGQTGALAAVLPASAPTEAERIGSTTPKIVEVIPSLPSQRESSSDSPQAARSGTIVTPVAPSTQPNQTVSPVAIEPSVDLPDAVARPTEPTVAKPVTKTPVASSPRLIAQTKSDSAAAGSNLQGIEIFDLSKLDRIPEPTYRTEPQYPFEMRRRGVSGEVIVEFIVAINGKVMNAFALKSTNREFEANAIAAVTKWKFKPGRKNGRDVNTRMQVPIVFTLNDH